MPGPPQTIHAFCLRLLERGDLPTKLAPPRGSDGAPLPDVSVGPAVLVDRPARDASLRMARGAERPPRAPHTQTPRARPLRRAISTYIEDPLSEKLLSGELEGRNKILVKRVGEEDGLQFEAVDDPSLREKPEQEKPVKAGAEST